MDKTFRRYDPHQVFLMPPSIDEWLRRIIWPGFVADLVDETVDLEPFLASYTEGLCRSAPSGPRGSRVEHP